MSQPLPTAAPEDVGLSSAGLDSVDAAIAAEVAKGDLAGCITLVARHGKVARITAHGLADIASGRPVAEDTIFRIYSMTKPVTGAAMMVLYDEGRWLPDDPIAKHLPEFEGVRVLTGIADDGSPLTAPADHPPTLRELLTHTAGFSYGFSEIPVDQLYKAVDVWGAPNLAEFSKRLASVPLTYQPGAAWLYSISMDVQGAIIEKLSGQSLPDFYQSRLFAPLGMDDTGFWLEEAERGRFATQYRTSRKGGVREEPRDLFPFSYFSRPPIASGGGGLVSTIHDYSRFAQMLLNKGGLDGVRVLSPEAIALMSSNHLPAQMMQAGFGVGAQQIRPGFGHGFDCAVFIDPDAAGIPVGKGTFQWDGAAGTWFWVDPANDLIFVGMIQRFDTLGQTVNCQQLTQRLMAGALL